MSMTKHDGSISLDELYQIELVVGDLLKDYIRGGSYEGNGRNWNFEFNGKPFLMRIEKDEFHTRHWIENQIGLWDDTERQYFRGLELKYPIDLKKTNFKESFFPPLKDEEVN